MRTAQVAAAASRTPSDQLQQRTDTASRPGELSTTNSYGTAAGMRATSSESTSDFTITGLPLQRGDSYHGLLRLASPASPDDPTTQSGARVGVASLLPLPAGDGASLAGSSRHSSVYDLPTYRTFRLTHLLFDLPSTLFILLAFFLLSVFGWPSTNAPYPHKLHTNELLLGAMAWLASEAVRRRLFRFASRQTARVFQSSALLLLVHISVQESLRAFSLHLMFPANHNLESHPPLGLSPFLYPPRPPKGFFRAFALALGFAVAETLWRTLEMLGSVRLYESARSHPTPFFAVP